MPSLGGFMKDPSGRSTLLHLDAAIGRWAARSCASARVISRNPKARCFGPQQRGQHRRQRHCISAPLASVIPDK